MKEIYCWSEKECTAFNFLGSLSLHEIGEKGRRTRRKCLASQLRKEADRPNEEENHPISGPGACRSSDQVHRNKEA